MKRTGLRRTLLFLISLLSVYVVVLVVTEHQTLSANLATQEKSKQELTFDKVVQPFFANHCYECHNEERRTSNLDLGAYDTAASLTNDRPRLKRILERLSAGEMPPAQMPRPKQAELVPVIEWLTQQLGVSQTRNDSGIVTKPEEKTSGPVTVRRLNRVEYDNTVRDLLGVDRHSSDDFPQDDSGYGFDNIGDVLSISPVLMEKYLAAAEKISRTAIFGNESIKPTLERLRSGERNQKPQLTPLTDYDVTGVSMPNSFHSTYRFPVDAEYVLRVNLGGERPPGSEALQLSLWIDGKLSQEMQVDPATIASFVSASEPQQLWGVKREFKVTLSAGDHWIAVAIPHLYEGLPASYNGPNPSKRPVPPPLVFRTPRDATPMEIEERRKAFEKKQAEKIPANSARIGSVELGGPYVAAKGPSIESPKKVYACGHLNGHHQKSCARVIVQSLAHRAYRRPVTPTEITGLTNLVSQVQRDTGSFEDGLAVAIQAMLLSPHFLFRIESQPVALRSAKSTSSLSQHELASRLSYFLWSSMPDDALLAAADRGRLARPEILAAQVRRMLLDPKASALIDNFGGQWLQTRKLESVKPDHKKFPDFDEYLRLSMKRETELFIESILREDRSILDYIDADYSYVNERLARFYGLANVQGPDFRKVQFAHNAQRGGLLTQASVLTISSYANRTSPVLRGKWVLENLVGAPPPPPPPDVPNLDEAKIGTTSSMREQLEQHRKNAICSSCHSRMDPLGFGLENFDAVGAWRAKDGDFPINATGTLPDGRSFTGPEGLKSILKAQPDAFTETLTRKMLIYALGRGLEPSDNGAVKEIVKKVAADNYRFSSLILGIVNSEPFQRRRGESSK